MDAWKRRVAGREGSAIPLNRSGEGDPAAPAACYSASIAAVNRDSGPAAAREGRGRVGSESRPAPGNVPQACASAIAFRVASATSREAASGSAAASASIRALNGSVVTGPS
jgi:hypothetical protein